MPSHLPTGSEETSSSSLRKISAARRLLATLMRHLKSEAAVPYLAEADAPAGYTLRPFNHRDFPGLQLCYVVRLDRGANDKVVSVWATRDACDAHRIALARFLRLPPFRGGLVAGLVTRHEPWFRRLWSTLRRPSVLVSILSTTIALATNLKELRALEHALFNAPEFVLAEVPTQNVVQSEQVEARVNLPVRNYSDFDGYLTLTKLVTSSSTSGAIAAGALPRVPLMKALEGTTITVPFTPAKPGEVEVTVEAVASNAWHVTRANPLGPFHVVVWPALAAEVLTVRSVDAEPSTEGIAEFTIRAGRTWPDGVTCYVMIAKEPGLRFDETVDCRELGTTTTATLSPPADDPGNELIRADWTGAAMNAFSTRTAIFHLKSHSPRSPAEWASVKDHLRVSVLRKTPP